MTAKIDSWKRVLSQLSRFEQAMLGATKPRKIHLTVEVGKVLSP